MSHVLVVDDSAVDRKLAGRLLEKHGIDVRYAANGREALREIEQSLPDVVVSDLQMPEMNGLELVESVRAEFPSVPVVLMTALGSEQIAADALRRGAASYVPKSAIAQDLVRTVERISLASEADRLHSRLMHALQEDACCFELRNDPDLIGPVAGHIQELLRCLPLQDQSERLRVAMAVKHALQIADVHGNLEVPVDLDVDDETLDQLVATRRGNQPYSDRCVLFRTQLSRSEAIFIITHEGPGIAFDHLPADLSYHAAEHSWLSGFLMLPAIMDDIQYSPDGCTISLLKKAVSEVYVEVGEE